MHFIRPSKFIGLILFLIPLISFQSGLYADSPSSSGARSDIWYEKMRTLTGMETQQSIREIIRYQKEHGLADSNPRIVTAKIYAYLYLDDIENLKKSLAIAEKLDLDIRYYFDYLHGLYVLKSSDGSPVEEIIEIAKERIEIAKQLTDKDFILQSKAQLMMRLNGIDNSKALKIGKELADGFDETLTLTTKIDLSFRLAYLHMWMNSHGDKALYYFNQTLKYLLKTNNHRQISMIYNNLGYHFRRKDDHQTSLRYQEKSLEYAILSNSAVDTFWANVAVADAFSSLGEANKAIDYYENSLNFLTGSISDFDRTDVLERIALAHVRNGNFELAASYLDRVESNQNYIDRIKKIEWAYESYLRLKSLVLSGSNNFKEAYKIALERGDFLEKELENMEANRFSDTELELENNLNQSLIEDLKSQIAQQSENEKDLALQFAFWGLVLLSSVVSVMIWLGYRHKAFVVNELNQQMFNKLLETEIHRVREFGGKSCLLASVENNWETLKSHYSNLVCQSRMDNIHQFIILGHSAEEVNDSLILNPGNFVGLTNINDTDTQPVDVLDRSEQALLIARQYRKQPHVIR